MQPQPFPDCPAMDGCHCQSSSLAKMFHYYGHPISEEMILGLGAGQGFFYWQQKGTWPFTGGRSNVQNFFSDLASRCGISIESKTTSSIKKAREALLNKIDRKEPMMVFGDMAYIPWFDHFPDGYHFGGHTFVICGYDGKETFLGADIDPKATGVKKGFYAPISSQQLEDARNSPHKPFPPKNHWLEFDFTGFRHPTEIDIYDSIRQTIKDMIEPPISNMGVKGIRRTAREMKKWPSMFDEQTTRMVLFQFYIYIEIGGTGGGMFRYMYSRFLEEVAGLTGNMDLLRAAEMINDSGRLFSESGKLFREFEGDYDIEGRIDSAGKILNEIADLETKAYLELEQALH